MTGEIPTELGNLSKPLVLEGNLHDAVALHGNQLTGEIPTELGNLSNLQELSPQGLPESIDRGDTDGVGQISPTWRRWTSGGTN